MIYKRTLYNYIFREICSIFLVSLLIFIFVILMTRMVGMAEMIIAHRVQASQVFTILLCLIPQTSLFALPPACLMCILLTFLRLSSDNEIVALQASGISLYQLLPPVFLFSLLIYISSSLVIMYWVPWGNRSHKEIMLRIAESKYDLLLKERVFTESFAGVMFYINSLSAKDRVLRNLFVVDQRDPLLTYTIISKKGRVISDPDSKSVVIHFIDGTIFTVDDNHKSTRTIRFDTYDLNIDLEPILSALVSQERRDREMSVMELYDHLRQTPIYHEAYNRIGIRFYEMFSIPMAILLLGLIGAPLGAQIRTGKLIKGVIISLGIYLSYYICLETVRYFCESGRVPPSLGVWIPNSLLLIICVVLIIRTGRDRPLFPLKLRPLPGFRSRMA